MPLFEDLRRLLIEYKKSSISARQDILRTAANEWEQDYSDCFADRDKFIQLISQQAYTATLINYAEAIRCIEQQDYFDILIDFKMTDLFKEERFSRLNEYFEFHPTAPKMRLKKTLANIPKEIWDLFRSAQDVRIRGFSTQKAKLFKLDELLTANPSIDEQLYPLPIQMFGRYHNEAVDRVSMSSDGKFRFAHRFGVYLLPGGGMVENFDREMLKVKMLEEHLEEEHANLYMTATPYFNAVDRDAFITCLREVLESKKASMAETLYTELLAELAKTELNNGEKLSRQVQHIDQQLGADADILFGSDDMRSLHELRAALQVETFKLTTLYQEAVAYIEANTTQVDIEQFCDTRACGGRQLSHCFLMTGESLDSWFQTKFSGMAGEPGDDLSGSHIEKMTFWESLSAFERVKFSHILIVLQEQIFCLNKGVIPLELAALQDRGEYLKASRALITRANLLAEQLNVQLTPVPTPTNSGVVEGGIYKASQGDKRTADADANESEDQVKRPKLN